MKFAYFPTLCLIFSVQLQDELCVGVIVERFFEQKCSRAAGGFVTQNFVNWMANLTEESPVYFPMLSKLDLLRLTQDLFQTPDLSPISGPDILSSCITGRVSQKTEFRATFSGYCGKSFSKVLTSEEPKVFDWKKLFPEGVDGSFRISLSDNLSWQLVDVCWGDGQRSWAVISARPYLSPCTQRVIVEHLKAIGFSQEFFTGLSYDQCDGGCHISQIEQPYLTGRAATYGYVGGYRY